MSKRDDVLQVLSRYADGLSTRDLQAKLPVSWFETADHNKEVRNALEGLRKRGQVRTFDPTGTGMITWQAIQPPASTVPDEVMALAANAVVVDVSEVLEVNHPAAGHVMEDEPLSDADIDELLAKSAVSDESMALAADVAAIVQVPEAPVYDMNFEPMVVPERSETVGRAVLPNGIEWVWAAKTTDGQLFEDVERACKHQQALEFESELFGFSESFEVGPDGLQVIRTWENWKAGRIAA